MSKHFQNDSSQKLWVNCFMSWELQPLTNKQKITAHPGLFQQWTNAYCTWMSCEFLGQQMVDVGRRPNKMQRVKIKYSVQYIKLHYFQSWARYFYWINYLRNWLVQWPRTVFGSCIVIVCFSWSLGHHTSSIPFGRWYGTIKYHTNKLGEHSSWRPQPLLNWSLLF